MKTGYAYRIQQEWELIINYYSGDVTVTHIKDLMSRLSKDPGYSSKYDTINDFRDSDLQIKIEEISEYIQFLNQELDIIDQRRIIFLTTKPKEVVITQLFADLIKSYSIQAKIFTTTEACLDWISNRNIDYNSFNESIEDIRSSVASSL